MANKRDNGEGCLRKRKNGTWEAIVTVSVDPVTHKQKFKSLYAKTRKEAKAKMEAFYGDKLAGFAGAKNRANDFGYFIADVAAGTEPFSCDCVIRTRVL